MLKLRWQDCWSNKRLRKATYVKDWVSEGEGRGRGRSKSEKWTMRKARKDLIRAHMTMQTNADTETRRKDDAMI